MKHHLLILLVLTLLTNFSYAEQKKAISLQQTVETQHVSSSQISPDGEFVAYTLNVPRKVYQADNGKAYSELHLVNLKGKSRRYISGEVNVSNLSWSSDSRYIYYLAKRNEDKFKGVYRIAVDGGESEKVTDFKSNITSYSVNHKSNKLVFLAVTPDDESVKKLSKKGFIAKIYEEENKKKRAYLVELGKNKQAAKKIVIEDHLLSVSFHPKKDQLLMRVTPTALVDDDYTASEYRIYSIKGELQKSFKTQGKLGNAEWSPNGNYVALIGAEDMHDPATGRLYLANTKSAKINELVKNYPGHIKYLKWLSDHQLAYLGHVGTQSEISVINIDNQTIINKISNNKIVFRSIDTDALGEVLIATGSSSEHPREVFGLTNGKAKRLTHSNDWLDKLVMPKQESITYKARDGIELEGILVYPQDYNKFKRYPLIMMVHGGPESHISNEWLDRYSYPIKHAASKGFAVFLPNYRGSTGRGVEFSKKGQADYAGAEFDDLVDAITHLTNIGLVDKKRVGITGGSYGGYASAWGATALSEHFAASVMFVGISNQLSKFGTTDIPREMYNVHARNYPWDKWQWMLERSPIYHTDKAKTPILIMHGEKDTRVHPSQSMELYRYIKTRTDTPARLVLYPDEPHGNRKTAAQLDYAKRLMRWMEFYLKGKDKGKKLPPYELDHKQKIEALDAKK